MLRKIKLYGHLREHTGFKELEAHVFNVREAINFLVCNWPKLEAQIIQNNYQVLLDNEEVAEDELLHPIGYANISFIPVVEGSGKFGKILAGAALIGLTFTGMPLIGGASFTKAGGLSFANAATLSKTAFGVGSLLVLSGVSNLLTPTPTIPETEQTPESSAFTSPLNVSMPGIAIPLVYGTAITGSIVVNTSVEIGEAE